MKLVEIWREAARAFLMTCAAEAIAGGRKSKLMLEVWLRAFPGN
jgi:hypothetical protein